MKSKQQEQTESSAQPDADFFIGKLLIINKPYRTDYFIIKTVRSDGVYTDLICCDLQTNANRTIWLDILDYAEYEIA